MASVAADLSAIAPPLPPPGRADAALAAGPSGAFADMLDASAVPAPAPQPQQAPPGPQTGDGSNAAQTAGAAAGGSSSLSLAGAAPSSGHNKDSGGNKSTGDSADDSNSAGNAAANITVVAGLTVPIAFAPLPDADQTPAPSQDAQTTSANAAAPLQDGTSGPPSDHKDSDPPSDPIAAGIAAAIPGLVPIVTVVAPASSAPAGTNPVGSLPSGASIAASPSSAPSAGAPAASGDDSHVTPSAAQQPNGTNQNSRPASTSVLDLLTALQPAASAAPAAGELQGAVLPALASAAANSGAPDRNASSAAAAPPSIAPDAASGRGATIAAAAALNSPAVMPALLAPNQVAAETITNTDAPRNAEPIGTTLPTQIAVRFAAPAHADDDASSDNGSDVLRGASIGGTALPGSGQPGAAITPAFTGILSTMQTAPSAPTAPQHAAVTTDAVTLAAVPIAIVARAEGGERKFEIRLDPPDLGRIDVQLNVDSSGHATSHLVVDRATTLDLLRRDAPALERALQSAGLTTDSGSLQFSLRDQSFAGREQALPAPPATPVTPSGGDSDIAPIDTALRRYGPTAGLGGGIDIRV